MGAVAFQQWESLVEMQLSMKEGSDGGKLVSQEDLRERGGPSISG